MHHNFFIQTGEDVKLANKFLINFAISCANKSERTLLIIPRPVGNKLLDEIKEHHQVKKFIDPSNSIKAIIVGDHLHICFITMSRSINTLSRFIGSNYNFLVKKYKSIIFASAIDNEIYNENFSKYCSSILIFDDIKNFNNTNLAKIFKSIATLKKNNESIKLTDIIVSGYYEKDQHLTEIMIQMTKLFGSVNDVSTINLPEGYNYSSCFLSYKEPWDKTAVELSYIGKRVAEK